MNLEEITARVQEILASATSCLKFSVSSVYRGICVEYTRPGEENKWYGLKPGVYLSADFSRAELEHRLEGLRKLKLKANF